MQKPMMSYLISSYTNSVFTRVLQVSEGMLKCTIIIIIMGFRSVSASEDVIGDPSRPGTNNNVLLDPRREEREKVMGKADRFPF